MFITFVIESYETKLWDINVFVMHCNLSISKTIFTVLVRYHVKFIDETETCIRRCRLLYVCFNLEERQNRDTKY